MIHLTYQIKGVDVPVITKLKLIANILFAKRVHIVDYDGFILCKIGSKDKTDKGISRISSLNKNNG